MQLKSFKLFLKNDENNKLKNLLEKLPANHRNILKNIRIEFQNGHTIKGSKKFVGSADDKEFKIAAPWFYAREFVVLHEIGHLVWDKILTNQQKTEWKTICKNNSEECFCHAYANFYAKHKLEFLNNSKQIDFITKLT